MKQINSSTRIRKWAGVAMATTLSITALNPNVAQARNGSVQILAEEISLTENCGISADLITQTLQDEAKAQALRITRRNPDFILFADVDIIPIPNSLGLWSGSCAYNINLELQKHQEIDIDRVGDVLVSARLCKFGYSGFMSGTNAEYFSDTLSQTVGSCLDQLPRNLQRAIGYDGQ